MVDKSTQIKLAERLGGAVPSRSSLWDTEVYKGSSFAPLFAAMRGSLERGLAKPRAPKIYEVYDALGGLMQEVGLGKVSPQDALKIGQKALLDICEKCLLE
jgi:multiple sugar transport system substrate-binding protein